MPLRPPVASPGMVSPQAQASSCSQKGPHTTASPMSLHCRHLALSAVLLEHRWMVLKTRSVGPSLLASLKRLDEIVRLLYGGRHIPNKLFDVELDIPDLLLERTDGLRVEVVFQIKHIIP
jgi:hypothetical protein